MRWRGRRKSNNIEDRRGTFSQGGTGRRVGGGTAILVVLAGLIFGSDVSNILGLLLGGGQSPQSQAQQASRHSQGQNQSQDQNDEAAQFTAVILAETEDTWNKVFQQMGRQYRAPKLVLYTGRVQSACGVSSAASGPFYCPGDYQVYIDLSFLSELRRMGANGDFAFAYVIAHEVGHHVQNLVGIAKQVRQEQARASKVQANGLSVSMELQADCLAGVWINHTESRNAILEPGDIEEGLRAAAAVGDDTIMQRSGRAPRREMFTHGSAQERMDWFRRGMQTGNIESCNTFG